MANGVSEMGRTILVLGAFLVVIGLVLMLGGRIPGFGRLPGDIVVRRGNFTFYFPLVTCLLLSLLLTALFALLRR